MRYFRAFFGQNHLLTENARNQSIARATQFLQISIQHRETRPVGERQSNQAILHQCGCFPMWRSSQYKMILLWYNFPMFDEPGSNYQPQPAPKRTTPEPEPKLETSPKSEPVQQSGNTRILIPASRPLWVRVLGFYLGFQTITRLFNLSGENPAAILVQIIAVCMMAIMTLGILGMRRWGVWFFMIYAVWTIMNSLVAGTARLLVVDEVIESVSTQQMVMASELILMVITITFNSAVALWVALNRKKFIPMNGPGRYGPAPFVVMAATLLLLTVTQVQNARQDVAEQGEIVESTDFSLPDFLR